jgi:hypothetical protein
MKLSWELIIIVLCILMVIGMLMLVSGCTLHTTLSNDGLTFSITRAPSIYAIE